MKSNIIKHSLHGISMKYVLCALALTMTTSTFAQDDFDDEVISVKQPKRKVAADKNVTIKVKGVVVEQSTQQPVAGVRVQTLADKRYTAMTDAKGEFTIKVPTFATSLYVEAPNHLSQQVAINAGDSLQKVHIVLLPDAFSPMYSNSTEYTAKNSFISRGGGVTIDEEIEDRLGADVHSVMHSGNLDQGASMYIRGINSLNGNAQPLIILDGVELDMQRDQASLHQGDIFNMLSTISPEDIDKVTVLKNATALYGARGANGVILIDTKRGHSLATRIDVKVSAGVSLIPSTPTMMNGSQYRSYAVEQLGTISEVQEAQKSSSTMMNFKFMNDNPASYGYQNYHNNTNWNDYIYKTSITQNYSINVQGGDDIGMYNLSVGYVDAAKNVKESDFNRINVRFNTDINILDCLTTKFDMSFSKTNTTLFDDGFSSDMTTNPVTSPTNLALIKSPLLYPYQYNQNINGFTSLLSEADDLFEDLGTKYSLSNPVALISNGSGDRKNKNENTFFNVAVAPTWKINDHWSATTHFSYYLNRNSQAYYRPDGGLASFYVEGLGTVRSMVASIFSKENNVISNTHVDWNQKFGAHDVAVTGGFRFNTFSYDNGDLETEYKNALTDDKNPQLAVGDNYYSSISGVDDSWRNMQWYLNGDYSYANKYFATVSVLAEANSRFGKNASGALNMFGMKWAIFPSVQMGWIMSNEKWFPKTPLINYVQLHAGFDMSGNDDISNYASKTTFSSVRFLSSQIGMQMTNVGNDEIKWETTYKWNFGFKSNFFSNRLGLTFDYFVSNTNDLLTQQTLKNPIAGINNYWCNGGKLRNQGVEVGLNIKPIVTKDWNLEMGLSVGHYKNELIELPARYVQDGARTFSDGTYLSSVYGTNNILSAVGCPVGVFYGYRTSGVFATTEEAQSVSTGVSHVNSKGYTTTNLYMVDDTGAKVDFEAGDVHFVDVNGDGVINELDKTIIGNPNPDIYGNIYATLTWKRFTLNMGFNYSIGNDVYNYQRSILNSGSTLYNQQVSEVAHWRYEGQITDLPKLCYGDPMNNNRFSDRWIEDGSYLRLKTLSIAYKIPIPESWQGWLMGISVWGEARNLFTLTRYTGNDPEFSIGNSQMYQGIDCGNVALSRTFTLGLKVNL